MAIELLGKKDEDKEKQAQGQAQTAAPQGPQSSESAFGGGSSGRVAQGGPQATQGAARRGGTGFTNLSRIVGANKDNKLAGAVGGGIQRTVGDVKQGLGQATQGFKQQAEANRLDTDANKAARQAVLDRYKYEANAQAAGPSEEEINKFQQFQAGQYTGPQALDNEEQLIAKSRVAEGLGQAAGSQEGRLNLLNRFVANKGYTGGQRRLDNLLLGQSAGGALKEARRGTLGLGSKAATEADVARQQALGLQGAAKQFGEETQGALSGAVDVYGQKLGERAKSAQDLYNQQYADLQRQLETGELSEETAARLGLKEGDYTWDANNLASLARFNQAGPAAQFNRANVASAQEAARINALKALGGNRLAGEQERLAQEFADPSKAGTAQTSVLSEIGAQAPEVQNFLKQSEAGIKAGGAWQGAERRANEAGYALKGIQDFENSDKTYRDFYSNQLNPVLQKLDKYKNYNNDQAFAQGYQNAFDQNKISADLSSQKKAIEQADMGVKQYENLIKQGYDSRTYKPEILAKMKADLAKQNQQYQDLYDANKTYQQLAPQAKTLADSRINAMNASYMGGSTMRNKDFETQKQKEAQAEIDRMRGKQIKIKKGPSGLPSLQELLSRR